MVKVLLTFKELQAEEQVDELRQCYPSVTFVNPSTRDEENREVVDADAIIGWPTNEQVRLADKLRWVHVSSAGIDPIKEIPELIHNDVTLTNGRGSFGNCIADHCFAMILAFTRQLHELRDDQRASIWSGRERGPQMRELSDATLGIVGLGNIGAEIAHRAVGFRMNIVAVDLNPAAQAPGVEQAWCLDRLDELLQVSDYVAVSVPRTRETIGLIDARRLALMKPSSYLAVVSRGRIVEEQALITALQEGRLAGAGLDVTATEPLPADSPLWQLPNVIITPHVSGAATQTGDRRKKLLLENLRRFVAGETLLNICDKAAGF